jgi:hypothetical protein
MVIFLYAGTELAIYSNIKTEMRFLPKPRFEGRKATESVVFADMDIVSLTVR